MRKSKRIASILSLMICMSMLCMMVFGTGMTNGTVMAAAEETVEEIVEPASDTVEEDTESETSIVEPESVDAAKEQEADVTTEVADETELSEEAISPDGVEAPADAEASDADDEIIPDELEILNESENDNPPETSMESERPDAAEIPDDSVSSEQPDTSTEPESSSSDSTVEPEKTDTTMEPDNIDSTQETEIPDATPEPEQPDVTVEPITTPEPDMPEYDYLIQIIPPLNWTKEDSADVLIRVRDQSGYGWDKIEVRASHTDWQDISEYFLTVDEMDFPVYDNGSIVVRITDPDGSYHETQAVIGCFDREAPLLTAGIVDESLQAVALDSLSGVAGIGVNDFLFTTLDSGSLDVRLESRLNQYKQLKVYAYDSVGNVSEEVVLDNPYYASSVCSTKKPSSGSSGNTSSKPIATAAPTATPTPEPTATPAPQITYSPGTPFQMDGNMQTLDLLFSGNTNKQFISVQTRSGETYYLVIDYDKPIDEEGELYETYFLNLVDDRDLMDVVAEEDYATPEPEVIYVTPEPTEVPDKEPAETDDDDGSNMGGILALLALAGAGGGALWYFKFRKGDTKKQTNNAFDEYDFDDEEETEEE